MKIFILYVLIWCILKHPRLLSILRCSCFLTMHLLQPASPFDFVSEICCLFSYSAQTVLRRDPFFVWKGFLAVQIECRIGVLGSRAVPVLVLDEEVHEHEV